MSLLEIIETGKAPVIFAPLICEPTTTTSSTSLNLVASSCAKAVNVKGNMSAINTLK